jgi:ribonuclease HI
METKPYRYTLDGSRNEQGVGAGVTMFSGNELVTALNYRLDIRCSNNQAEQLTIAKALEALERLILRKIVHALQQ